MTNPGVVDERRRAGPGAIDAVGSVLMSGHELILIDTVLTRGRFGFEV
jgi:hypothetical protein